VRPKLRRRTLTRSKMDMRGTWRRKRGVRLRELRLPGTRNHPKKKGGRGKDLVRVRKKREGEGLLPREGSQGTSGQYARGPSVNARQKGFTRRKVFGENLAYDVIEPRLSQINVQKERGGSKDQRAAKTPNPRKEVGC